ncbi:MAG: hypothetical protein AAGM22_02655, partial [Acidobacteriota bacterium]
PISYISPERYIQHNLAVADGLAGFGEVMKSAPPGGFKAEVVRAFEDGDFVFTHTRYDFFGPKVGFDIFRFEDGLIVEHWDNLAEIAPPNPSGRTQLDGPTAVGDRSQTEANKQVVEALINEVFLGGGMQKIADYISPVTYVQHNSNVGDGLEALGKAFQDPEAPAMVYRRLHKVLGEGNFVLSVSEGSLGDEPTSFYDLFRLEDGKIVEHWDVIEKILPKAERKNSNGKFNFSGTDLVGKQIRHRWTKGPFAGASFTTLFCSESLMAWNNTSNPEAITSDREAYVRTELADGVVQLSWKEDPKKTNFGLIWTLNFNTQTVYGVIVNASPTENVNLEGHFEVFDTLEVGEGLNGCP